MINPYDYDLAVAENAALFLLMLVGNVACKGRSSPQVINRRSKEPEGSPGHFYRLRLAHLHDTQVTKDLSVFVI
jgi:hypothetical protein